MTGSEAMAAAAAAMTRAGDGEARWWFGGLCEVKLTAADTNGAFTLLEVTDAPDVEAPWHVHHREDEGFFVLEGSGTFQVGDTVAEARPGDVVWGPRGVPHRFRTGPDGIRMLFLFTPGGFEELVYATSVPAATRTLPPADVVPPEDVAHIVRRFGAELLG